MRRNTIITATLTLLRISKFTLRFIIHHNSEITLSLMQSESLSTRCHSNWQLFLSHCHVTFSVRGPTVWNSVPYDFRSTDISLDTFKNKLKTFLFHAHTRLHIRCICEIIIIIIIIIIITKRDTRRRGSLLCIILNRWKDSLKINALAYQQI